MFNDMNPCAKKHAAEFPKHIATNMGIDEGTPSKPACTENNNTVAHKIQWRCRAEPATALVVWVLVFYDRSIH